jgi:hypothetical protein
LAQGQLDLMQKITADFQTVGTVSLSDATVFIKWIWEQREKTDFDPQVLSYPRACMTIAKSGDEPLMFIPLQPVLFFESMAKKPGLSDKEAALCMWKIGEIVEQTMKLTGHAESYFITNSETESVTCSRHGWTVVMHDAEKNLWLMKRKTEVVPPCE